ncbi:hypothetical protein [Christensenella minuta]|uniref:hypothetical protein n=1 Tax=Christensenella minuta TaxID=626937 RepID=UPI0021571F8A|nr:hypothetical protein [Christensenella minuta]
MAGEMTQAEETAVMNGSTDSGEGAASEETAQEWNDEEFVSAFDGTEEIGGEEELEKESETEKEEAAVKPEGERTAEKATLEIGGREYTASDVEGLLSRITELQAAVNTVSPEREFVERLAAQAGMDVEAFLQDGGRMLAERQIQARTAQLVDQGLEESMARHVAELEVERDSVKNAESMRKNSETQVQDAQMRAEAQMRANVEEFARMFPDVKNIPDEVIRDIETTGATPVVAYQKYLLDQKEKELAAARQAEKNRKQTTGSVKTAPKGEEDPFLIGLFSD